MSVGEVSGRSCWLLGEVLRRLEKKKIKKIKLINLIKSKFD